MRPAQDDLRLGMAPLTRETKPDGALLRCRGERGGVRPVQRQRFEKLPRLRVVARIVMIEHGSSEGGGAEPAGPAGVV